MFETFRKSKISAVIVIYNPQIDLLNTIVVSICDFVHSVVICNNSLFSIELSNKFPNVTILNFNKNLGIAEAQNIGYEFAIREFSSEYILNLDQDSILSESFLNSYFTSFEFILTKFKKVGVFGPLIVDSKSKIHDTATISKGTNLGNNIFEVPLIINSGSLISVNAYKLVSGFSNKLFIDYVDFDICWRIKNSGYNILLDKNSILFHSIGNNIVNLYLFQFPIHNPLRNYFQFRNYFYLIFKKYVPFKWKFINGVRLFFYFIFFWLTLQQPFKRTYYIFFGLLDFISMKNNRFV